MGRARLVSLHLFVLLIAAAPEACYSRSEMSYMLLEGSILVEDCPMCARLPIVVPLRGTFLLVLREMNPLMTTFDVQEVQFESWGSAPAYTVTGDGTYEIGGEVALIQKMKLQVQINDITDIELESGELPEGKTWPMIEVYVSQEPIDPLQVFSLHIIAAPVREIWFSTRTGFTSGETKQSVSAGDLLSHGGRTVKSNSDLVGRLGIMPVVPDLGLDAFDVAPGGEALFSIEEDVHSETLGRLQHGDLLSDHGRIVRTNQEVTLPFSPQPPAPDVGLDAVQAMDDGEILFSVEEEIFSEALGVVLRRGDLLSDRGVIVRTNEELLANFEPTDEQGDRGLDAIHVWPGGEIWFSTELGFQSKSLGPIGDGDLLSDDGSIVCRNLELLRQFAPLEKLADFGLDSLFLVVEDLLAVPSVRDTTITLDRSAGDVIIKWQSDGKVFQVERADEPGGPYSPLAPITTETTCTDRNASPAKRKSFYRIREW